MQKKEVRATELRIELTRLRPVRSWSSVEIQLEFPVGVPNPDEKSSARTQNAPTVKVFEGIWSYKTYILYFLRVETSVAAVI